MSHELNGTREAVEFLEYAIECHQYYADRPEECNQWTDTPERNKELVEIYSGIINLIEEK